MWCQKGDIIQSKSTGRFFLVLSEETEFGISYGSRTISYRISLQPLKPFRNRGNHPIKVKMTASQLRAFHIGYGFVPEDRFDGKKDCEPWELTPAQLEWEPYYTALPER